MGVAMRFEMIRFFRPWVLAVLLVFAATGLSAQGTALSNSDVEKMVAAGLDSGVIVLTIRSSEARFSTLPDDLISLKQAGVPADVIEAMLTKNAAPASTSASGSSSGLAAQQDVARVNPEEILMLDGAEKTRMRYTVARLRTAARGMGFGGVGTYAALPGTQANLRTTNRRPSFLIAVPGNAAPETYLTLANFAVRRNGTREVSIGGGYMSYSTGIHPDRVIRTLGEELADQSGAPEGFSLYKVTPQQDLAPGEYALVTYNSQVRIAGFFAAGNDSYFDFGID